LENTEEELNEIITVYTNAIERAKRL